MFRAFLRCKTDRTMFAVLIHWSSLRTRRFGSILGIFNAFCLIDVIFNAQISVIVFYSMSVVEAVLQTLSSLKFESTSTDQSDNRPTTFDAETIETAVWLV